MVGVLGIAFVILGIACLAYGIAIMRVSSGTGFFMVWYALAVLFGIASWAMISGTWAALPPLARDGSAALAVLAVAVFFVAYVNIERHSHDVGKPELDYIIVLGAQVRSDGPSVVLLRRMEAAADYLAANPSTRCIASGGQGANEPESEAKAIKRFMSECDIASSRIALEDRSTSTCENLAFSRELIEPGSSVGIVTSDFHMYRALATARKQGFRGAVGIAAPSSRFFLPNNVLRETLAIGKALLKGDM